MHAAAPSECRNGFGDDLLSERLSAAAVANQIAGASLAVWNAGETRLAAAGWANIEAGIAADTGTIFQIGSITKVFTASLLMMLRDQGLVDIDAPVTTYLPAFRLDQPGAADAITIRMLLTYTSGIAGEFFQDFGPGPESLAAYVAACAQLPILFKPGTMRGYSSTAYCVAGRVIEVVTGSFYEQALADRLLTPAGLQRFAFYTHDIARFRTAIGYEPGDDGQLSPTAALRLPHCMSSSGASLTMSALDLLRFGLLHLHSGIAADGTQLLRASSCAEMVQVTRTVPPGASPVMIGWAELPTSAGRLVIASGHTVGQNAILALMPDADFAIAILANTSGGAQKLLMSLGSALLQEGTGAILRMPIVETGAVRPQPPFDRYAGDYTNHSRASAIAAETGLDLMLEAKDATSDRVTRQTISLHPIGDDRFVAGPPESPAAIFRFLFNDGDHQASHFALGGALFARCDSDGRTGIRL